MLHIRAIPANKVEELEETTGTKIGFNFFTIGCRGMSTCVDGDVLGQEQMLGNHL